MAKACNTQRRQNWGDRAVGLGCCAKVQLSISSVHPENRSHSQVNGWRRLNSENQSNCKTQVEVHEHMDRKGTELREKMRQHKMTGLEGKGSRKAKMGTGYSEPANTACQLSQANHTTSMGWGRNVEVRILSSLFCLCGSEVEGGHQAGISNG